MVRRCNPIDALPGLTGMGRNTTTPGEAGTTGRTPGGAVRGRPGRVAGSLTGLALLAVGFSSNGRRKGPQPYMWAAGFTALPGLVATAAIWSEVVFRAPIPLGATEGTLFWVGLTSALGAVVSVAAGTAARHRLRRQLRQKLDQP